MIPDYILGSLRLIHNGHLLLLLMNMTLSQLVHRSHVACTTCRVIVVIIVSQQMQSLLPAL